MRLMREIRFSVGPGTDAPVTNSWGGWPTAGGVQPYLVLRARVEGTPDPLTGYLCNIKLIDELIRGRTIPLVRRLVAAGPQTGERLVMAVAADLADHAPNGTRWADWQLCITPFLNYTIEAGAMNMVHVSQRFEFAASHRLHCPALNDEENRRVFGKCNNPNGHGHNYEVEVTLAGEPDAEHGLVAPVAVFERVVRERVIDRFDHRHLNEDCAEFREMNPSVENITRVIWSLLDGQFAPAALKRVRVWETPKTSAEYEGP